MDASTTSAEEEDLKKMKAYVTTYHWRLMRTLHVKGLLTVDLGAETNHPEARDFQAILPANSDKKELLANASKEVEEVVCESFLLNLAGFFDDHGTMKRFAEWLCEYRHLDWRRPDSKPLLSGQRFGLYDTDCIHEFSPIIEKLDKDQAEFLGRNVTEDNTLLDICANIVQKHITGPGGEGKFNRLAAKLGYGELLRKVNINVDKAAMVLLSAWCRTRRRKDATLTKLFEHMFSEEVGLASAVHEIIITTKAFGCERYEPKKDLTPTAAEGVVPMDVTGSALVVLEHPAVRTLCNVLDVQKVGRVDWRKLYDILREDGVCGAGLEDDYRTAENGPTYNLLDTWIQKKAEITVDMLSNALDRAELKGSLKKFRSDMQT